MDKKIREALTFAVEEKNAEGEEMSYADKEMYKK